MPYSPAGPSGSSEALDGKISGAETESVLEELDETISRKKDYEESLRRRIDANHGALLNAVSDDERYAALDRLYDEFYQYDIDSAVFYAREKLALAAMIGSEDRILDAELDLAGRYALSGMYSEVLSIVGVMEPDRLPPEKRPAYYHVCKTLYEGMEMLSDDKVLSSEYRLKKNEYRKLLLETLGGNDISRLYVETEISLDEGRAAETISRVNAWISENELSVHEKAIIHYILSDACRRTGNEDEAVYHLARSAMYDIMTPVKEYKSLYELAALLYGRGDIKRAYRYITISVEDAVAANAMINIQSINSILPIITGSYARQVAGSQRQMLLFLVGISLLSSALAVAILFTVRAKKKTAAANAELREYVSLLQESNNMKEMYIGRYIDMCSYYIGGLERYRSSLRKSAKSGGFAEVMEKLRSSDFIDRELEDFYAQFDATFLSLFPDFVEQLNTLLQPDKRIENKSKDGILTTELRVAALIRLGVDDSVKIAYFLRRSVSTIYNYRVKMRNAALSDREEFEKQIMRIGKIE